MDKAKLIKFMDKVIKKYMAAAIDNLGYIEICDNIDMDDSKQAIEEECNALRYEFSELLKEDESGTPYAKVLDAYENNIGPMTTMIRESILDWLNTMDADVIVWAVGEAVKRNKRSWSYIEAILRNHANAGRTTLAAVEGASRNYLRDKCDSGLYKSDIDHDALEEIIMGNL